MRDFLKWGHDELGAIGHISEVTASWFFDGPKFHYIQEFQWDVNADPDKIMWNYCSGSYGKASGPMKAFWDKLEEVYERRKPERRLVFYMCLGWHECSDEFDLYTLFDVTFFDSCIAQAEKMAATEEGSFRVARVADAWRYYRTYLLGKLIYADRQAEILLKRKGLMQMPLQCRGNWLNCGIRGSSFLKRCLPTRI